jgi:pimeloyl-ACP methyl ester carboxylesterase
VRADSAEILVEGAWRHRFVAANGGRFHIAEAGTGPLVLLLHGFPQFWWVWRHQLTALAEAGFHAVAMDLRGYGASDKPPRGYDTPTLAADVAGVVRTLGASSAVVVGHDWGGWIAWSMPSLQPRVTRAIAALSTTHPLAARSRASRRQQLSMSRRLLGLQLPLVPERWLADQDGVEQILSEWSGDGTADPEAVRRYTRAMQLPFVAHTTVEYYRWSVRSLIRRDGRRFADAIRDPVTVPVLQIHGARDPWILPELAASSRRWAGSLGRYEIVARAGHFLPEETPDTVSALLVDWLRGLPPPG